MKKKSSDDRIIAIESMSMDTLKRGGAPVSIITLSQLFNRLDGLNKKEQRLKIAIGALEGLKGEVVAKRLNGKTESYCSKTKGDSEIESLSLPLNSELSYAFAISCPKDRAIQLDDSAFVQAEHEQLKEDFELASGQGVSQIINCCKSFDSKHDQKDIKRAVYIECEVDGLTIRTTPTFTKKTHLDEKGRLKPLTEILSRGQTLKVLDGRQKVCLLGVYDKNNTELPLHLHAIVMSDDDVEKHVDVGHVVRLGQISQVKNDSFISEPVEKFSTVKLKKPTRQNSWQR